MKVVNIVATVILPEPFDLQTLHTLIPESYFSPKSPWLKLRLPPNNTYIAFYKSGKFLVTGKSIDQINQITQIVLLKLNKVGIMTAEFKIIIHNLVGTDQIEMKLNLESLMSYLDPKKASYEPEQFLALVFKDWGASFLLFNSGKMIVSGVKNEVDAKSVIEKFQTLIEKSYI